jgi:hypothetical protein
MNMFSGVVGCRKEQQKNNVNSKGVATLDSPVMSPVTLCCANEVRTSARLGLCSGAAMSDGNTSEKDAVQDPPIDGGLRGWSAGTSRNIIICFRPLISLSVAGAWLIQFCMVGTVTSFGVTQTYYKQQFLSKYTLSQLSWIGSVQLFLEYIFGLSVGQL